MKVSYQICWVELRNPYAVNLLGLCAAAAVQPSNYTSKLGTSFAKWAQPIRTRLSRACQAAKWPVNKPMINEGVRLSTSHLLNIFWDCIASTLTDWLLTNWLTDCLTDWLTVGRTDCLTDWALVISVGSDSSHRGALVPLPFCMMHHVCAQFDTDCARCWL